MRALRRASRNSRSSSGSRISVAYGRLSTSRRRLRAYADASCACCVRWLLARAAEAGRYLPRNSADPADRLRHGGARARQARRARAELFLRHRHRCLLRPQSAPLAARRGARPFLRAPGQRAREADAGAHAGRLCFPHGPETAARPRVHAHGDRAAFRLLLLRNRRPELGARGTDQGAAGGWRPAHRRGVPGRTRAVHLAQIFRLRRHRRHPRHEAADPRGARAREDRGGRPRHQARARGHPRDRVLRPDPATRLRGPPAALRGSRTLDMLSALRADRLDLAGGREPS